jgi:hypothetical protein
MTERGGLSRLLFGLGCLLAGLLAALVASAPWLAAGGPAGPWGRVAALFAHDAAVRRTALAAAAGLVVSACVFFRPQVWEWPRRRCRRGRDVAGA